MAIRFISPQQLDLYHFDTARRKYDAQHPELEKAVQNLPRFIERISKELAELPKNSGSQQTFSSACESIQTHLSMIDRIKRHIQTLSHELQKISQQMDEATDPLMQKMQQQFPALMEQLEREITLKIPLPAFENHQYKVLRFFNKVEELKSKMEKSAERVSAVTRQFERFQKEYAQRGTRSIASTPKSEKSPGNPYFTSSYYSPLNPAFASLPLYSPGFPTGTLPSSFSPQVFTLSSRATSRAPSNPASRPTSKPPSRPLSRTGFSATFESGFPTSPSREEVVFEQPKSSLRIDTRSRIPKSISDPSFYDLDYDSDGYEGDEGIPPVSRVRMKAHSTRKSKSWESGLDGALRSTDQDIEREFESAMRAKPLYSTDNFYNEYGIEGSDLHIHINAIHERAEDYREFPPNNVEYNIFRTQLEYTSVRAQKIADTVEQDSSAYLETLIDEETVRSKLRQVILDLNAIDQVAQLVMRSAPTQKKWEGGILQLGQFCRVIVGAYTALQRVIDQGEAIWPYTRLVKSKARELVCAPKVASVFVSQLDTLVLQGTLLGNHLQARRPIYFQKDIQPDVILDKVTLAEVVGELMQNLFVIQKSCSTPAIRKTPIFANFNKLVKDFEGCQQKIDGVVQPLINALSALNLLPGVLNIMILKYAIGFCDGDVQLQDL